MEPDKNQTRYHGYDLERVVRDALLIPLDLSSLEEKEQTNACVKLARQEGFTLLGARPLVDGHHRRFTYTRRRWDRNEYINVWKGHDTLAGYDVEKKVLHVRSPGWLLKHPDFALGTTLALHSEAGPYAPGFLVRAIAAAVLRGRLFGLSVGEPRKGNLLSYLDEVAVEVAENHTVRVGARVEAPLERRVRTTEEKVERLLSSSFYGPGGVLEGPRWGYSKGNRAATGQWSSRISSARSYYETERTARERHAAALRELGVEPPPYETFPQYLRRVAEEMETAEANGTYWRRRW